MTTGDLIRAARQRSGMTQEMLGKFCGVTNVSISRYECGYCAVSVAMLKKIAKALEIDWRTLCPQNEAPAAPKIVKVRPKMSKYNARKFSFRGEEFDSIKEYTRYRELLFLAVGGKIRNLRRQVKYELVPAQYVDGKCVERALSYIADFVYEDESGEVVEDVKGFKTPEYIIKRKLMLYLKGIRVRET